MADEKKTPARYILTDAGKKSIATHAQLEADLHRAKRLVEDPNYAPKRLEEECKACFDATLEGHTRGIEKMIKQVNGLVGELEKNERLKIEVGSQTVYLESQEDIDKLVDAMVVVKSSVDTRAEKRYYDLVLDMRGKLTEREKGIKDGTLPPFNDLDIIRLHDLNDDIRRAGEQNKLDKDKLEIDYHKTELRVYESRLKSKENPTSYEKIQMADDQRRLALVKDWLKKDELAYAEKRKPPASIPDSPPIIVEERSRADNVPVPRAMPPAKEEAPMPRPKETTKPGGGRQSRLELDGASVVVESKPSEVFAAAASDVRGILAGSTFTSDFVAVPMALADGERKR